MDNAQIVLANLVIAQIVIVKTLTTCLKSESFTSLASTPLSHRLLILVTEHSRSLE